MIHEQVDGLNVEIGRVDLLSDAHLDLLSHKIGKGAVNRLPHQPLDATSDLELSSAGRATDLKPVEADLTLIVYRRRINRSRCKGINGNHVATTLLGNTDESLFTAFIVDD